MPTNTTGQRLLLHLRRIARARDADSSDSHLLGAFVATQDGDAFAALVRRHGPMVLGVCRRVIGDAHLAEDAFQATFLVLARRAAAIRPRHLLGNWLYGVAYRTALKARGSAARRMAKEKQVEAMPQPAISPDEAWADLQPILDAEMSRLPDKYRIPVVLCDLGGRPQREVARELKLPAATLANRLAAARRLLAKRLTDRGVVLSASAVGSALGWHAATSAVSPVLINSTVQAACAAAAGGTISLSAPILELSEGVMRMFVLKKLKAIAAGVATVMFLVAGVGFVTGPSLHANPEEKPIAPATKDAPPKPKRLAVDSDDAVFLRRLSLDLRGTVPSALEMHYFLADKDPKKRQKVTDWMLPEHGRRPVSKMCSSCHQGVAMADFDNDGFLDIAIANGKSRQHWSATVNYNQLLGDWLMQSPDKRMADEAKANVEEAKATLQAARADLLRADAMAKGVKQGVEQAQNEALRAKANLAQAEAQFKLAEAKLESIQKVSRLQINKPADEKKEKDRVEQLNRELEQIYWLSRDKKGEPTDLEFLRRMSLDIRGVLPSKVEENYFLADKDPKKREKLLQFLAGTGKAETGREKLIESLLADPSVQARWVELWKQKMAVERQRERAQAAIDAWMQKPNDPLARLLNNLLSANKSDDQVLDALCLATMARFATGTERKLILDGLKLQPDRRAAWDGVLRALASTDEAKAHAEALAKRSSK